MGIPWRSAESMHWQLGEQEMSSRANAPVFQLHPSATSAETPASTHAAQPPNFTPVNAGQLAPGPKPQAQPHQQSQPHQQHGPPEDHYTVPSQSYHHQRSESSSSNQGRRRNPSFSRRRSDPKSRSSVPLQLAPLPSIQPTCPSDLISGPRTTSVLETYSGHGFKREADYTGIGIKREPDAGSLAEPYFKRRRESAGGASLRPESDSHSIGGRSPDRLSQHSMSGSVKSVHHKDAPEPSHSKLEPPPPPPERVSSRKG